MAEPISGRVTGIAVDPSNPNHPDDTFVFNVTPGPDDKGDTSIIIDYREGGFTGGVFVASGDISGDAAGLPYIESSLPAVQSEHVVDGFEHTQPLVSGHYTLWDHTFEPPVG
jgi:hypothetical protein